MIVSSFKNGLSVTNLVEDNDVAFLELYRETIINLLVKLDGYDYSEAVNKWYNAYRDFDSKVYKLIEYIIKHGKPKILLNRNPKQFMWGI